MELTAEQIEKAKQAKTAEELLTFAKESGIELTEEKAKQIFSQLHKEGEVADEELDNVSGGVCSDDWRRLISGDYTDIYCQSCNWTTTWKGKYDEGVHYQGPCPVCNAPYIYAGEYHE